MSCPRGYVAPQPQELTVGGNACSHSTPYLLLGLLLPLNLPSGEVGCENGVQEAASLPGSSSDSASNKRRNGREGIVDPAPGAPGESAAPGI